MRGREPSGTSGLSALNKDHLSGTATRLAALLLAQIFPIFSLVAPCDPGAALRNLVLVQRGQATSLHHVPRDGSALRVYCTTGACQLKRHQALLRRAERHLACPCLAARSTVVRIEVQTGAIPPCWLHLLSDSELNRRAQAQAHRASLRGSIVVRQTAMTKHGEL
jgi:hypothetical protein